MNDQQWMRDSELLARAVHGELGRDDDALRELLRRRPEWRDVLDELEDGGEDGAPSELRALAAADTSESDRERMSALVARVSAGAAAAPGAHWGRRALPPLAAVLVAALGLIWWFQEPVPEVPRGPFLGSGGVSWVAPADTVGAWESFEWEAALPRGGSFSVTVRADDAQGTLLARGEGLVQPSWSPDPVAASAWPNAIVVTVEVLESSGILHGSLDVPLRRSSH